MTSSIHQLSRRNFQLQNRQHTGSTPRWRLSRQISTRKWRYFLQLGPDCHMPSPAPVEGSCGPCSKRSACKFLLPCPSRRQLRGSCVGQRAGDIRHCAVPGAVLHKQSSTSGSYQHNPNIVRESVGQAVYRHFHTSGGGPRGQVNGNIRGIWRSYTEVRNRDGRCIRECSSPRAGRSRAGARSKRTALPIDGGRRADRPQCGYRGYDKEE
jgi:hypothetical protein